MLWSSTGSLHGSTVVSQHFQSCSEALISASVKSAQTANPPALLGGGGDRLEKSFFLSCLHLPSQQALQWPRKQGRTSHPDARHRLLLPTGPRIRWACRDRSLGHCLFSQRAHTRRLHHAHSTGSALLQGDGECPACKPGCRHTQLLSQEACWSFGPGISYQEGLTSPVDHSSCG